MIKFIMISLLSLSIANVSNAQETQEKYNQLCMISNQPPPMIQDCENKNYRKLIEEKANQIERLLIEKKEIVEDIINNMKRIPGARLDDINHLDYDTQKKWRSFFFEIMRLKMFIFKNTHKNYNKKKYEEIKECMENDFKFKLMSARLSYMEGELRSLCQLYGRELNRQVGNISNSAQPVVGVKVHTQ